jgi:D-apiose dehydrogenase
MPILSQKLWRGGMIGAGAWSTNQLNGWSRVPNARIVALCDRDDDRLTAAVSRFEIPGGYSDAEEMLARGDLDFVDICTRPSSHASLTRLAARRGLNVLCQKPFCTSLAEASDTVAYCDEQGVRLMINENYRWQPWYRRAKELLDSGALGASFFAVIHDRARLSLPRFDSRQTYLAEMPRLILYEMGPHYFDLMRFLFGEPESVHCRLQHISDQVRGEDVLHITLGYPGLTAVINSSWASVPVGTVTESDQSLIRPPRFEIDGTEGTMAVGDDGSTNIYTDSDLRTWRGSRDPVESYVATQAHFVDCLDNGAEFETSGSDTLKTMALIYRAYESAETG